MRRTSRPSDPTMPAESARLGDVTGESTPSLSEFLAALRLIRSHMPPTPLSPAGPRLTSGCKQLLTKHENLTPVRSFKIRGALHRISLLTEEERGKGVVTSSTGNHGMGVAFAARELGTNAVVVVPTDASELKIDGIRHLGAEIRRVGANLAEADATAEEISRREGRTLILDGNDRGLMVGAGALAFEILEAAPHADVLVVPVGGGNLIAGVASCAKLISPAIEVIGVQSAAAPAVHDSFKAGHPVFVASRTFAGGLAGDRPGNLAFAAIERHVDDIVLVGDDELRAAMLSALTEVGQVLEGAGAASLAALQTLSDRLEGRTVVAILSGGNAELDQLASALGA